MPRIVRRLQHRRDYDDIHRFQLRWGFDASWQRFGIESVSCRRRDGASDCRDADMPAVESAWHALRDELLATVDDPRKIWAYRRFDLHIEPLGVDYSAFPAVPPIDLLDVAERDGIEAARKYWIEKQMGNLE